jgi:hypothetical protein
MLRRILAPLVLLSLAASVAASSSTFDSKFSTDFKTLDIDAHATGTGSDASSLRSYIDQSGNNDGTVTTAEVTTFKTQFGSSLTSELEKQIKEHTLLDDVAPSSATASGLAITGAEGKTTSTAAIDIAVHVTAAFTPGAGPAHVLKILKDAKQGDDSANSYTFHAPTGYKITGATGFPSTISSDGKTATLDRAAGTPDADALVTFEQVKTTTPKSGEAPNSKGSPAAGIILVGAVLALAAVARRHE